MFARVALFYVLRRDWRINRGALINGSGKGRACI